MAAGTFTVTANMAAPARAVHAGLNATVWSKGATATAFGTANDVLLLAKIPNKAVITRIDGTAMNGATAMNYLLKVGYTEGSGSATVVTISPSITGGATRMSISNPYKVSISDDQALQYATLQLVVTTGASASVSLTAYGVVEYLADGQSV